MKTYGIVMILVGLLFLTSCSDNSGTAYTTGKSWIGGTQGVEISYEIDAPPDSVTAGDSFNVIVTVNNKGEHTVKSGDYFLKLKGIRAENFGVADSNDLTVFPEDDLIANELDPDTNDVLESYEVYVQIPKDVDLVYDETAGLTSNSFPFMTDICYTYKTYANAQLCIKEDLSDTKDADVCMVTGDRPVSSSSGPVQISNFQQFRGGSGKVRFSFLLMESNAGGEVSRMDTACSHETMDDHYVYLVVDSGMDGLTCTGLTESTSGGEGYVKLSGGSKTITCTQPVAEDDLGDYINIVDITAEYDYESSITRDVFVKKQID